MARTAVLGLPRVGPDRELKFALESYWAGRTGEPELRETAAGLRAAGWRRAEAAGIDVIPSGDHSLYDHVLDTAWALERRSRALRRARAPRASTPTSPWRGAAPAARPLEMTKWLDTNYHYLVPELARRARRFRARPGHWAEQIAQAQQLGIATRPVVLGPFSFLRLSKGLARPLEALDALVPVYAELLAALAAAGAREVQIDEPCLALDLTGEELDAAAARPRRPGGGGGAAGSSPWRPTSPPSSRETLARLAALPLGELHLDLVRGPEQLAPALAALGATPIAPLAGRDRRPQRLGHRPRRARSATSTRPPRRSAASA